MVVVEIPVDPRCDWRMKAIGAAVGVFFVLRESEITLKSDA